MVISLLNVLQSIVLQFQPVRVYHKVIFSRHMCYTSNTKKFKVEKTNKSDVRKYFPFTEHRYTLKIFDLKLIKIILSNHDLALHHISKEKQIKLLNYQ